MLLLRLLPLLALLGACASQPTALKDSQWQLHEASLQTLQNWQFSGKVAIRTPQRAESARLEWAQQAGQSELVLSGPMGWNQMTLLLGDDGLMLFSDGHWQRLDDPTQLEQQLGWEPPIKQLRWWVRGLPAPGSRIAAMELSEGRLALLQQGGWQLTYENYQAVEQWVLPGRIRFQQGELSGKILLKQWQLTQ